MDASEIFTILLSVTNHLKLYHLQTKSYARHVASDQLFASLLAKTDKLMETLIGQTGKDISVDTKLALKSVGDEEVEELIASLARTLEKMRVDGAAGNIRDEICEDIYKALYLFRLK